MAAFFYLLKSKNLAIFLNILNAILLALSFCILLEVGWKRWQILNVGIILAITFGIFVIFTLFAVQQKHDSELETSKKENQRLVGFEKF